jgi:tetratricopeptide (TPR) repeat protein
MIRQRLYDEAINVYKNAVESIENAANFHLEIGNLYRSKLNYEKAVEHFLEYYIHYPKQIPLIRRQILTLTEQNQSIQPVVSAMNHFLNKHPKQVVVREILAGLYVKQREFEEAFIIYQTLDNNSPDGKYIKIYADEAYKNDAFNHAIQGYNKFIEMYPKSSLLYHVNYTLGQCYIKHAYHLRDKQLEAQAENEIIKAINIFKSLTQKPGRSNYHKISLIELGDIYLEFYYDNDNALKFYHNFLNLKPKGKPRDEVLLKLGNTYLTKNQIEMAKNSFKQISQKDYFTLAQFKISQLAFYQGNFAKSLTILENLLKITRVGDPLFNDILSHQLFITNFSKDSVSLKKYALAELLLFQKKYSEATVQLNEIVKEKSALSLTAGKKGSHLLIELDKLGEAEILLQKLWDNHAHDETIDEVIFYLADTKQKLGKQRNALDLYKELLANYPNSLYIQDARQQARILNSVFQEEQI